VRTSADSAIRCLAPGLCTRALVTCYQLRKYTMRATGAPVHAESMLPQAPTLTRASGMRSSLFTSSRCPACASWPTTSSSASSRAPTKRSPPSLGASRTVSPASRSSAPARRGHAQPRPLAPLSVPHRLEQAIKGKVTTGLVVESDTPAPSHCKLCIRGKHHRNPFPQRASHRATSFLERIHSNLH
jgi:hypothetical protein